VSEGIQLGVLLEVGVPGAMETPMNID